MKHYIEKKAYDEATAELIHEFESRLPRDNFRWVHEQLFKAESGQYFVVGEGGPLSHYAATEDERNWSWGRDAYLLSPEEALDWLLSREAKVEVIEEHFSLQVG
jgi:hypothetical protein